MHSVRAHAMIKPSLSSPGDTNKFNLKHSACDRQHEVRKHLVKLKFPATNKRAGFCELLVCSAGCCLWSLHKWSWGWRGHCAAGSSSHSRTSSEAVTGLGSNPHSWKKTTSKKSKQNSKIILPPMWNQNIMWSSLKCLSCCLFVWPKRFFM